MDVETAACHFSAFQRQPGGISGKETYLDNATYEHVVTLMVDPVLQHHFIYHGDEDLVLKTTGQTKQVNKRMEDGLMWLGTCI